MSLDVNNDLSNYKYQSGSLVCVVCVAPAAGKNFNATTCQSCKAFFRRNAAKNSRLTQCSKDRLCTIDAASRRHCSYCRLKKCLAAGMNPDLIRTRKNNEEKGKCSTQMRRVRKPKRFPSEDSPVHEPVVPDVHCIALRRIRFAYENRTEYLRHLDTERSDVLSDPDVNVLFLSLGDMFNARSKMILQMILFFKSASTEFQTMNNDDKVTLLKFNVPTLFWINLALFYDPISNTFSDSEENRIILDGKNLIDFYGLAIYDRLIPSLCLLRLYICIDAAIIYLLMLILFFSHFSTCVALAEPILNDQHHVRRAQNFYITTLVQLLIERVGESQANLIVAKLTGICLNFQNISRDIWCIESTQISEEQLCSFMNVFLIR